MTRVFEKTIPYLQSIERKIVTDESVTTQYIHNETTAEAEKRLRMPIVFQGEIKGKVWREFSQSIVGIGWHDVKEFIRERIKNHNYIEIGN